MGQIDIGTRTRLFLDDVLLTQLRAVIVRRLIARQPFELAVVPASEADAIDSCAVRPETQMVFVFDSPLESEPDEATLASMFEEIRSTGVLHLVAH